MRSWSHTHWLDDPSQSTVESVVIGGGQAGLAMSWYPGQAGRDHVVDERRTGVGGWQDRWDGFRLVTAELETVASPVESLVPVVRGLHGRRDRAHELSSGRRSKADSPTCATRARPSLTVRPWRRDD